MRDISGVLRIKNLLPWFGMALTLLGVVFISLRLNDHSSQLDFTAIKQLSWVIIFVFAVVYGIANVLLALAWRNLLKHFGSPVSRDSAIEVYGVSQLAKYVPSNIMHLASRQVMGLARGIAGWPLTKAAVWELVLISITAMFFSVLVFPQYFQTSSPLSALAVFLVALGVVFVVLNRHVSFTVAQTLGYYTAFLTLSGMIFVGLLILVADEVSVSFSGMSFLCGSFVVAWLAGLVTPGSPAGVGVREAVLMVLLNDRIPEPNLLMAILLSRIVCVLGDGLFFLYSSYYSHE